MEPFCKKGEAVTIRELKEIIADWPEQDGSGEECEVWMTTGNGTSSEVRRAWPLNVRYHDGCKSGDLLLESDAFIEKKSEEEPTA